MHRIVSIIKLYSHGQEIYRIVSQDIDDESYKVNIYVALL